MAELTQAEQEAQVAAAQQHLKLIYAGNPDSLILDPAGDISQQTARSLRAVRERVGAASMTLAELQTLAYNQKSMAVVALEQVTASETDPAWTAQLREGLDYERKMDYAEEAIDAYEAYWRVTAIGAIAMNARLARTRAEAGWRTTGMPAEYRSELATLDAAWMRGDLGVRTVESLLADAITLPGTISRVLAAGEKAKDDSNPARRLWDQIPDWGKGLAVVVGVLVLGNLLLGVLPSRRR